MRPCEKVIFRALSKTKKTWTSGHLCLLENAMRWNDSGLDDVLCIEGVPSMLARRT